MLECAGFLCSFGGRQYLIKSQIFQNLPGCSQFHRNLLRRQETSTCDAIMGWPLVVEFQIDKVDAVALCVSGIDKYEMELDAIVLRQMFAILPRNRERPIAFRLCGARAPVTWNMTYSRHVITSNHYYYYYSLLSIARMNATT